MGRKALQKGRQPKQEANKRTASRPLLVSTVAQVVNKTTLERQPYFSQLN